MFTVIFHDKEFYPFLEEYMTFLQSSIDREEFVLCRWNTAGITVEQAVPELYDLVGERKEWRAIVLTHIFCDAAENPFDFFSGEEPAEVVEQQPLVRLTHMLSAVPHRVAVEADEEDARKEEYMMNHPVEFRTINQDKTYYQKPTGNYDLKCYRPLQIVLVATRQIQDGKVYIPQRHGGCCYKHDSLFWDRNDYPSNVRFLVYDLHTSSNRISSRDIFEMIGAIHTLAVNDMYTIKLQAYHLYRLSVEIDTRKMADVLADFQQHLLSISNEINHYRVILSGERLDKQNPGQLPNMKEEYIVEFPSDSVKELLVSKNGYGLAKDCPVLDEQKWYRDISKANIAFEIFKKKPIRCLKRSIETYRILEKEKNKLPQGYFDEFQLEDARVEMEKLEQEMFGFEIAGGLDYKEEDKKRIAQEKRVISFMGVRMPRKQMIFAGSIAMLIYLGGFIPFMISAFGDGLAMFQILIIVLMALGIFAGAGIWGMYKKYQALQAMLSDYNGIMLDIIHEAKLNQERFQRYISHAFNYRKYWYFIKHVNKREKEGTINGMPGKALLKRHMMAVEEANELCSKMRGLYSILEIPFYDIQNKHYYNFAVAPEKTGYYKVPEAAETYMITYNRAGQEIHAPYEYITNLKIEREALYDN